MLRVERELRLGEEGGVVDVPVIVLEFQQSKSHEKLEVPQIQLIVGVQDIPVVSQRQVPTVLQMQFLKVVDMPVVEQRQVRAAAVCRQGCQHPCRGAEADSRGSVCSEDHSDTPLQCVDKVINVLVVQVVQVPQMPVVEETDGSHSCSSSRKSLRSQPVLGQGCCMFVGVQQQVVFVTVQKAAEVPHVQFIDKVVAVPVDNLLIGGHGGDEAFFGLFQDIFRAPSIRTLSAR